MKKSSPPLVLHVLLFLGLLVSAFLSAKIIISLKQSKAEQKSMMKMKKGKAKFNRSEEKMPETFTMMSIPRRISEAGPLSPQSEQTQDETYWSAMDTLEATSAGAMATLTFNGEVYLALGDIIVPPGPDGIGRLFPGKRMPLPKPKLWPQGQIPHMIESTLSVKAELKAAIQELKDRTGIKFVSAYKAKDFVSFRSHKEHCLSSVGRVDGEQEVWLGPQCKKGEIFHALMHVLGFFHEQSRTDRDEYLTIFWSNLGQENWEQFKKIPSEFHNLLGSEFDFNSIMLYPPDAFAQDPNLATMAKLNGDLYTGNREELSPLDVMKISELYRYELQK